jgi:phage terminase large subunit-like protein
MIPNLTNKTHKELLNLYEATEALKFKFKYSYIDFVMTDHGPYRRQLYNKAMQFYEAGASYRIRMLAGANGVGKSFTGALELVYHATGLYPTWWKGKKLKSPKLIWIVAESGNTFKASLQRLLVGNTLGEEDLGTGLIPKECFVNKPTGWPSIAGAVMSMQVRHKDGHIVSIEIKSNHQNESDLQAANVDMVLFDEEPDYFVYSECITRLRSTPERGEPGIAILLFTSLKGLTDVVTTFLDGPIFPPNGISPKDPNKFIVRVEMDDVPHLTEEDKQLYILNTPPQLIDSRTKGLIALGAGKIYPYPESQVFCEPFKIPEYWPRAFSLDFGHHVTAVVWGAKDPHTNTLYIYSEYYSEGHQTAQVHTLNIKSKGSWIRGICDPSGGGRQNDGRLLQDIFTSLGLDLVPGENSILAGIARNCNMFEEGSLKIFNNLEYTKNEYRTYRFDSKDPNKPARNQKDHAMDSLRYLTSMFDYVATSELDEERSTSDYYNKRSGYDETTGY